MYDIDIIVPIYNSERYIINTLKSFSQQKYKNFRLILIDDGSTDGTVKLLKEYINKHINNMEIKLILQKNEGKEEARNKGIRNLKAKYVLFFDSDDFLLENSLYVLKEKIEENDYDIAFGSYQKVGMSCNENFIEKERIFSRKEIINDFFVKKIRLGIGNTLIKTEIITKNNLYFKKYEYGEDNHFFRQLLFYVNKGISTEENIFLYIQHINSTMHKSFTKKRFDVLDSIIDTEKFYKKNEKSSDIFIENLLVYYNLEFLSLIHLIIIENIDKLNLKILIRNYKKQMKLKYLIKNLNKKNINLYLKSNFLYFYCQYLKIKKFIIYNDIKLIFNIRKGEKN